MVHAGHSAGDWNPSGETTQYRGDPLGCILAWTPDQLRAELAVRRLGHVQIHARAPGGSVSWSGACMHHFCYERNGK
jgi:hypothetical protein